MPKVLVIDDDQDILDLVSFNLRKSGVECTTVLDGLRALDSIRRERPDLIVLDIMLPRISGLEVLKELKLERETSDIPVILLMAKSQELDRVAGLELGADDYVTKPFSVRELVLRVQKMLKRMDPQSQVTPALQCGAITVDLNRYEVVVRGRPLSLTSTEFSLLSYLVQNKGRVLTRDQLLEHVWGYEYFGSTRTVDTHIQRLREKLGDESGCILTVRGIGYGIDSGWSPRNAPPSFSSQ